LSAPYEAIVIGAGHNGLTAAGRLAARGRKVLVLERRDRLGGTTALEEFHPRYRCAGPLHDTTAVRPAVVRALGLEGHGLRLRGERPAVLALGRPGEGLLLHGEPARAAEEIAARSAGDAERYALYHEFHRSVRELLRGFLDEPPLDLVDPERTALRTWSRWALRLLRHGRRSATELLRLPPMSVADWLDEWFQDDLLKAALALPAVAPSFTGPRAPGTNLNLLLWEAAAGPGVQGGAASLGQALARAAAAAGAELRPSAAVRGVLVEQGRVRGVELADGSRVESPRVVAACDVKQALLELLPSGSISHRLERRLRSFRTRGVAASVRLALDRPPSFACRAGAAIEHARVAASLDDLERAFDAVKYRQASTEPVLDLHVPTVQSPELAPEGHAVLSALVYCAPYDLDPAWTDAERERLGERVLSILERHAPGVSASVVAREVLTPRDLEQRHGLSGGQLQHGEHALDQLLVRPAPECHGYRTPVDGLWLCGGGNHPGGGLSCVPGWLAAQAILQAR
jgi:phytoene dehydrogenase-like protein